MPGKHEGRHQRARQAAQDAAPVADEYITVAFDLKKMKVGCALMQAMFCTTISRYELDKLNDYWEIGDPSGMRVYKTTKAELEQLSKKLRKTA